MRLIPRNLLLLGTALVLTEHALAKAPVRSNAQNPIQPTKAVHFAFTSDKSSIGCNQVWNDLRLENWSDLQSLQYYGGLYVEPIDGDRCEGYKNFYGSDEDISKLRQEVQSRVYESSLNLNIVDVLATRGSGYFVDLYTNQFRYAFDLDFSSFEEMMNYESTMQNALQSSESLLSFLSDEHQATDYAQQLDAYFRAGNCLNSFTVRWRLTAVDTAGDTIPIFAKMNGINEICP